MRKIAIIGAGFTGLAIAWQLLNSSSEHAQITVFDSRGIGQGASGKAVGLLHPFTGAHAKLNAMGDDGMHATLELLDAAAQALGSPVTANQRGILRLALTQQQEDDYKKSASLHPHRLKWLTAEECQTLVPGCAKVPGLWIEEGMTVYAASYLNGLWKICSEKGVEFVHQKVHTLQELDHFDLTIVGAGAESSNLPELSAIPLKAVKGQVLEFAWPAGLEPLRYPLNSHVYILMSESKRSCLVGATFEKAFTDDSPSIEIAKEELLHKAFALYPPLETFSLIHCHAGLRAVTPQHLPLIRQISPKQWLLTGLGSKGLLYHALYAKKLMDLMVAYAG